MTNSIDFNRVIGYSRTMCYDKSRALCAEFVKKAFQRGGCEYIGGDGWNNQRWCEENGFMRIGDFVPIDGNPRAHGGMPIQFPPGYVQQAGDVCLIKHGLYGHMCYSTGPGINDWVSDYFQRPPGQQAGTGPYCYSGNIERVQFWRHKSVLSGAPVISSSYISPYDYSYSQAVISGVSNNVSRLSSVSRRNDNVLKQDDDRRQEFESLVASMAENAPKMGRDIMITSEMYDSNILKGTQESRKERV